MCKNDIGSFWQLLGLSGFRKVRTSLVVYEKISTFSGGPKSAGTSFAVLTDISYRYFCNMVEVDTTGEPGERPRCKAPVRLQTLPARSLPPLSEHCYERVARLRGNGPPNVSYPTMLFDKLDRAYDGTCTYLLLNPTVQCHQAVAVVVSSRLSEFFEFEIYTILIYTHGITSSCRSNAAYC